MKHSDLTNKIINRTNLGAKAIGYRCYQRVCNLLKQEPYRTDFHWSCKGDSTRDGNREGIISLLYQRNDKDSKEKKSEKESEEKKSDKDD